MRLNIHPDDPQRRHIVRVRDVLNDGGLIIYPTDSCYAFGCRFDAVDAVTRIRRIRQWGKEHFLSLVCRDLSELATYARVDNASYRLIRSLTPGPYTFILRATREFPRRLQDKKRKTIGLRIPDNNVAQQLLLELDEPLLSATVVDPNHDQILAEPDDIERQMGKQVDVFLDSGAGFAEPTTVIDLSQGEPTLVRAGAGPVEHIMDLN